MIQLRTNITPPINLDGGAKGAAGGILKILQPSLRGNVPLLGPVNYTPYGEPKDGVGLVAVVVLAVLVVVGFFTVLKFVFRR